MTPIVQVRDGRRSRLVAAAVAGAFALLFLLLLPRSAHAANATWPQNTALVLTGPGITLQIDANSTASSLAVTATTFTVVTGASDSFVVRYANPAGKLTNDGGITECNTQAGGDNLITVGPSKSITFTPSTVSCGSGGTGGGGGGGSVTPTVSVVLPNGGENLSSGTTSTIQWQTNGGSVSTMRLWLSTDSGVTYPTLIAQNESNDGSYSWAVPTITTTTHARVKVEAMSGTSSVLSSDTSNADFTITGTAPTTTPPPPATTPPAETPPVTTPAPATDSSVRGVYRAIEAISHNPTINDDKGLAAVQAIAEKHCTSGDLIKASQPSVYYCGSDGRRYVFVNEKAYKTWFADFKNVKTLTDAELSAIQIGGNVTYRPGVRMIKIQSDPKVYAISRGGTLRWVSTENAAKTLYGADWNKKIDDVSDAFFVNYKIGDDIKDSDVDPTTAPPASSTATAATVTSAAETVSSCTVDAPFTAYMSSGSSDPEVASLQGLLQCLGYIPAGTSLTGYYGAATESAVKQFQKANALSQVGYVGPSTREKLNQFVK